MFKNQAYAFILRFIYHLSLILSKYININYRIITFIPSTIKYK